VRTDLHQTNRHRNGHSLFSNHGDVMVIAYVATIATIDSKLARSVTRSLLSTDPTLEPTRLHDFCDSSLTWHDFGNGPSEALGLFSNAHSVPHAHDRLKLILGAQDLI